MSAKIEANKITGSYRRGLHRLIKQGKLPIRITGSSKIGFAWVTNHEGKTLLLRTFKTQKSAIAKGQQIFGHTPKVANV